MTYRGGKWNFEAEGMSPVQAEMAEGISAMRRFIYELDNQIEKQGYRQPPLQQMISISRSPPPDMDIPIFDGTEGRWRDAEC